MSNNVEITMDEYETWHKIDKQRIKKLVRRAEKAEAEVEALRKYATHTLRCFKSTNSTCFLDELLKE